MTPGNYPNATVDVNAEGRITAISSAPDPSLFPYQEVRQTSELPIAPVNTDVYLGEADGTPSGCDLNVNGTPALWNLAARATFQPDTAGFYMFTGTWQINNVTAGQELRCQWKRTGVSDERNYVVFENRQGATQSGVARIFSGTTIVEMAVGDIVWMIARSLQAQINIVYNPGQIRTTWGVIKVG